MDSESRREAIFKKQFGIRGHALPQTLSHQTSLSQIIPTNGHQLLPDLTFCQTQGGKN